MQPPMMPRPDVARLGIRYRRIPIMAIGRDVYLDTRLQLSKLEAMYPSLPTLGAANKDQQALQQLLSSFAIDGGIFSTAAQLIPTESPLLQSKEWAADRSDFSGAQFSTVAMKKRRPAALVEMARAFDLLESTLLADGREWVLGTASPSLADIEAVWPLHWLTTMPGSLPEDTFSATRYPRVYAWIKRFQGAVSAAKKRNEGKGVKVSKVTGEQAAKTITGAAWHEEDGEVDSQDAVVVALGGLGKGDAVKVWPTDTGSAHKDVGKLIRLDGEEVVWETGAADGVVRVHAPRHGYRIARAEEADVVKGKL